MSVSGAGQSLTQLQQIFKKFMECVYSEKSMNRFQKKLTSKQTSFNSTFSGTFRSSFCKFSPKEKAQTHTFMLQIISHLQTLTSLGSPRLKVKGLKQCSSCSLPLTSLPCGASMAQMVTGTFLRLPKGPKQVQDWHQVSAQYNVIESYKNSKSNKEIKQRKS